MHVLAFHKGTYCLMPLELQANAGESHRARTQGGSQADCIECKHPVYAKHALRDSSCKHEATKRRAYLSPTNDA